MTRYYVYDCTQPTGVTLHVRSRLLAHLAAVVLSKATRRFHDYSPRFSDTKWQG